jgi:hypothetical protein
VATSGIQLDDGEMLLGEGDPCTKKHPGGCRGECTYQLLPCWTADVKRVLHSAAEIKSWQPTISGDALNCSNEQDGSFFMGAKIARGVNSAGDGGSKGTCASHSLALFHARRISGPAL